MSRVYTDEKWKSSILLGQNSQYCLMIQGHKEGCCSSGVHKKDYIEYEHRYTRGCSSAAEGK